MELKKKRKGRPLSKICAFLWVYTGFPASSYEGINVEKVRENCGMFLAKRDSVKADLVSGVPDSGVAHAIGYAIESGIPYRRVLIKYTPGYGRSYTPLSQELRDRIALMKLIANDAIAQGNRIVLCEDSIVRGTQLKNYTVTKLDAGWCERSPCATSVSSTDVSLRLQLIYQIHPRVGRPESYPGT